MQLNYRGQTYAYTYAPVAQKPATVSPVVHQLIYRGQSYFTAMTAQKSQLPAAINWRFAMPCRTPAILKPAV